MITPTTDPLHHTSQSTRTDQEAVLIASLHEAMIENGVSVGQDEIANFYVALKSKPDEVMIYLANSWSRSGNGLFHPSPDRNLAIALDLAIAQILLPRAADAIRRLGTLRNHIENVLANQSPRSAAFLTALAAEG